MNEGAAAAVERREFSFSERDFDAVRRLIYAHAGINLSPAKRNLVYGRLVRRLRVRGITSFREYLQLLETDPAEQEAFVNALTTNLTAFFREAHHFDILQQHLLKRRAPITLWCAAASTGEEPYSIAMAAAEVFGTLTPPVRVLATDIDTEVLEVGRLGMYPLERIEKLSRERRANFFLCGRGAQRGRVRVKAELRNMIVFRRLNLLDAQWPLRGPFDAIFCRNVMIYFDKATQYRILQRFAPLLHPDGLLFAGHSESFSHAADLFSARGKTVYSVAPAARREGRP